MKIVEEDGSSAWKLGTLYVFGILRLIFLLNFLQKYFLSSFIENFTTHLLGKQSGLRVEKKNCYSQNTNEVRTSYTPFAAGNL